jgi:hypothetical protein
VLDLSNSVLLDQLMIAILRTPISTTMLLTLLVEDLVEMDLLFIQIHQNQVTKNAMRFQTMLLINAQMQEFSPTSPQKKYKCTLLLSSTQTLEQEQWFPLME